MEIEEENIDILNCRQQIENKLGWGNSDSWTNQDFEKLSEKIEEVTGINLSITTLKRIWGKVKYDSKPTITTLNTLVQFLGINSWREFVNQNPKLKENDILPKQNQENNKSIRNQSFRMIALVIAGVALAGSFIFYFFSFNDPASAQLNTSGYAFSSKKVVSSGVPNSVIFDYNAMAATGTDTVSIQQSWDPSLKQRVSKDDHQHTSIYYYPGFFEARLMVNKQMVKEHNLLIETKGWLPIVEEEPVPVYFSEADIIKDGTMSLPYEKLKENNISMQPVTPWIDYYNVRAFGNLKTDSFNFETVLRNNYSEGAAICQHSEIILLNEGSAIIVPLSIKGCVSDLKLNFFDKSANGKTQDLSAFGCDLSQWVKVQCQVINNTGKIFINDSLAYQTHFESAPTKITGIAFRFRGGGSVKSVKLSNANGDVVYEDDFK